MLGARLLSSADSDLASELSLQPLEDTFLQKSSRGCFSPSVFFSCILFSSLCSSSPIQTFLPILSFFSFPSHLPLPFVCLFVSTCMVKSRQIKTNLTNHIPIYVIQLYTNIQENQQHSNKSLLTAYMQFFLKKKTKNTKCLQIAIQPIGRRCQ